MQVPVTQPIDPSKVKSVYSGKPGCACGCRGKYSYRKAVQAEAGKARGYEVKDSECNDRQVEKVVALVNANLDKAWTTEDGAFVAFDLHENRTYTVYFEA